jgi:hypothetical protein
MICAKLLLIVTDPEARRRVLATWREFVIRQPAEGRGAGPAAGEVDGPVAFSRLTVREGLDLAVFIADGGWRREYVCQVLAEEVDGWCLLIGDAPEDLAAGLGLLRLIVDTRPGLVAGTAPGSEDLLREVLQLPRLAPVPIVDCEDAESVTMVVCELLERLAAIAIPA